MGRLMADKFGLIEKGWLVKVGGMYHAVYDDAPVGVANVIVKVRGTTVLAVPRQYIEKVIQVES